MTNKKSVLKTKSMKDSIATLGLTTLLTGGIMKLMGDYMFGMGDTEKIPKGVVMEMTQGMVKGFFEELHDKEYDIKSLKEDLEQKQEKLDEVTKEKINLQMEMDGLNSFIQKLKKSEKEKKEEKNETKVNKK